MSNKIMPHSSSSTFFFVHLIIIRFWTHTHTHKKVKRERKKNYKDLWRPIIGNDKGRTERAASVCNSMESCVVFLSLYFLLFIYLFELWSWPLVLLFLCLILSIWFIDRKRFVITFKYSGVQWWNHARKIAIKIILLGSKRFIKYLFCCCCCWKDKNENGIDDVR